MAPPTMTKKLTEGLKVLGWVESPSRSRKYRMFTNPSREIKLFLGPAGSLRKGDNVSNCVPVRDTFKQQVAALGAESLRPNESPRA